MRRWIRGSRGCWLTGSLLTRGPLNECMSSLNVLIGEPGHKTNRAIGGQGTEVATALGSCAETLGEFELETWLVGDEDLAYAGINSQPSNSRCSQEAAALLHSLMASALSCSGGRRERFTACGLNCMRGRGDELEIESSGYRVEVTSTDCESDGTTPADSIARERNSMTLGPPPLMPTCPPPELEHGNAEHRSFKPCRLTRSGLIETGMP